MRRLSAALVGLVATTAIVAAATPPASAAGKLSACTTSDKGAVGGMQYAWKSKSEMDVALSLADDRRDGAYPRIRLDITTGTGKRHTFPWRELRDGYGSSKTWKTSASHKDGIVTARVQVENVRGSSPLATCYSSKEHNIYY
ncbi:hypothetical protein ACFQWA_16715 [Streptomyces thermogriseus]|uniref:Secreted protein n=1 Tax=Streptomyces thermogriseus TaxID=75292 RepID=A0ABP4DDA3_9ACTN